MTITRRSFLFGAAAAPAALSGVGAAGLPPFASPAVEVHEGVVARLTDGAAAFLQGDDGGLWRRLSLAPLDGPAPDGLGHTVEVLAGHREGLQDGGLARAAVGAVQRGLGEIQAAAGPVEDHPGVGMVVQDLDQQELAGEQPARQLEGPVVERIRWRSLLSRFHDILSRFPGHALGRPPPGG